MLEHANILDRPAAGLRLHADVVVIGSGAGGAAFAAECAEAGLDVLLLEKGAHYDRRDFNQREADMFPRLFEGAGLRTTSDGGITILHGSVVGGSTTVNNAICFDPPAELLDVWAEQYGVTGLRLPELASALRKVRWVLNVQPITEDELNPNAQVLRAGAQRLGLRGAPFEHNRTSCLRAGFCMLGCAYDRKQSANVTYVPRALHFGARLVPFAYVERLVTHGRQIVAAVGTVKNHETGKTYALTVEGRIFVAAGGAISTPMLLMRSDLANGSGQLGRNLALHPLIPAFARFDEPIFAYKGIPQGYYVDHFATSQNGEGGFILEAIGAHPVMAANVMPGHGPELIRLLSQLNHMAGGYVQVHDETRGTLRLGDGGEPVIDYWPGAEDIRKVKQGWRELARIFLAAGAREVFLPHLAHPVIRAEADLASIGALDLAPCRQAIYAAHPMGTCAMGGDPSSSVVDSHGRAHDLTNLYVADASVFPTATGVNPQLTVMALATHAARHLIANLKHA